LTECADELTNVVEEWLLERFEASSPVGTVCVQGRLFFVSGWVVLAVLFASFLSR